MIRNLVLSLLFAGTVPAGTSTAGEPRTNGSASSRHLIVAFASLRERPAFSNLFFYRHDGKGASEPAGGIPAQFERADSHPTLTSEGRLCAHASKQVGGFTPQINFWEPRSNLPSAPGDLNSREGTRITPAVSGDGKWLACASRGHANSAGGWDVVLLETATGNVVPTPGLNTEFDEFDVAIDGAGRRLAYVSNRRNGAGLSDLALYDRAAGTSLEGVNTPYRELSPALSADGRWLAFVSDRPGGVGGKDVYLYDLAEKKLAPLPGLNSSGHDQTPALSPDGRFIAFVSERTRGSGERDIYLYDRTMSRLVSTPGLNSPQEDFDPALAYEQLDEIAPMK
jgi:Tol biopolymer transport system component